MRRTAVLFVALLLIAGFVGTMGAHANGGSVPIKSDRTHPTSTAALVPGDNMTEAPSDVVPPLTTGFEPAQGFGCGCIEGQNVGCLHPPSRLQWTESSS